MCANASEKKAAETLLRSQMPDLFAAAKSTSVAGTGEQQPLLASIKRALLESIVSGVASKHSDIVAYKNCFCKINHCKNLNANGDEDEDIEAYLQWLNKNEFISIVKNDGAYGDQTCQTVYKPTQLAFACVASAMAPDEALVIFGELQKALQCFVLENELHIIYQITPINICDYWTNSATTIDWNLFYNLLQSFTADFKRVADLVGVRQSFLLKMIKGNSSSSTAEANKLLKIHLRFFTALILNDLVNEHSFASVLSKYGCQKGFLQTLQQSSATYASMITIFCNRLGWFNFELLFNQFQTRLLFGVQRQLLDLVRIKLLNSHRARLFYNAGYTTVASIAMCDLKKLEKILRSAITFASSKQQNDEGGANVTHIGKLQWKYFRTPMIYCAKIWNRWALNVKQSS
jgi:DNA polymerase theta